MINYFNFQKWKDDFLITNDIGCYMFLNKEEFINLCNGRMNSEEPKYHELVEKGFIFEDHPYLSTTAFAERLRTYKEYLQYSTSLFMFVLTNECNMHCRYCQAQSEKKNEYGRMDRDTAERAINIALMSPCREITIEFQGGEPLLNFDLIRYIVETIQTKQHNHRIYYSIVTNSSLLTPEIIDYFRQSEISVSLSLDGNRGIQDYNRPMNSGKSNYECVKSVVEKLKAAGILSGAVMTTTRYSLDKAKEIIDEYLAQGFDDIFIRPLTPLGYAKDHWLEIGYSASDFTQFYEEMIEYILEINRTGKIFKENHACLFLNKIVNQISENYMELRSPCGAVMGQMAFNYDGNIYTCDEGRMLAQMGREEFFIGNVNKTSFTDLVRHSVCSSLCKASVIEAIPGCCDCVYMPYCGVCPATTYATENDIMTRTYHNYRCATYKGILDTIFKHLQKEEDRKILESWVKQV